MIPQHLIKLKREKTVSRFNEINTHFVSCLIKCQFLGLAYKQVLYHKIVFIAHHLQIKKLFTNDEIMRLFKNQFTCMHA